MAATDTGFVDYAREVRTEPRNADDEGVDGTLEFYAS